MFYNVDTFRTGQTGRTMRIKIAKWGNSAAIRLPKAVMDEMRLVPGSEAEMNVTNRVIHISSANKPKQLKLEELIKSMDEFGLAGESETVDWGPDRGSELIDDEYSRPDLTLNDLTGKKRAS